jgi:hypothetical protein
MAATHAALQPAQHGHFHTEGEVCPYCEQPVPNDRIEEIRARFDAKERQRFEGLKAEFEAAAKVQANQIQRDAATAIEKVRAEAAAQQNAAREEGRKAAEAGLQGKIVELTQANATLQSATREQVAEAERQKAQALAQLETTKANREAEVNQRVQEVRDAMEQEKVVAVNANDAKHFAELQKVNTKVIDLQRQLEKKTAEERGEGAEVDLYEALKAEFPTDRIERIARGAAGADIRHVVIHNSKECGTIIYDSKDRAQWRYDYVEKLSKDQRAAKADHAILSSRVFPQKASQLHIDGGIIIANPARVVALVQLLRKHLVHMHTMRLSNNERAKKTTALYEFITSPRCGDLLDSIDQYAEDLLDLQKKEVKAHENNWKQQGTLYRSIQKVCGDLVAEIDHIIESE